MNATATAGRLPQPTATELNILRILWKTGPSTVRCVHDALNKVEPSGYTTALKMLQVMHQKGLVERDASQRAHVYRAVASKAETQHQFLDDLVSRLFDGSTSALVLQALGNSPEAKEEELAKVRELLKDLQDQ